MGDKVPIETYNQICGDLDLANKEIERLRELVSEAYFEGWKNSNDDTIVENGWYESNVQQALTRE